MHQILDFSPLVELTVLFPQTLKLANLCLTAKKGWEGKELGERKGKEYSTLPCCNLGLSFAQMRLLISAIYFPAYCLLVYFFICWAPPWLATTATAGLFRSHHNVCYLSFGLTQLTLCWLLYSSVVGQQKYRVTVWVWYPVWEKSGKRLCRFVTSAKEVMFLPVFVCLCVCVCVCVW